MLHRGKIARDREVVAVRELEREDLEVLRPNRPPPVVERFRDSHHMVARFYAFGKKATEIAELTGYSLSRVIQLYQVPAFQNLISEYKKNVVDEEYRKLLQDYNALVTTNQFKAERQIGDKLDKSDEEGELLPTRDLISISRKQDRSTNIQVNVGDFATQLDRANKESTKVIQAITPQALPLGPPMVSPRRKLA